jgi:hypothetical protein
MHGMVRQVIVLDRDMAVWRCCRYLELCPVWKVDAGAVIDPWTSGLLEKLPKRSFELHILISTPYVLLFLYERKTCKNRKEKRLAREILAQTA